MKKTITLLILLFTLCLGRMEADMYLSGTMNEWSPDNASYKFTDNKLEVELNGSTTYNFKIVDGGKWRSCNTTITNTVINYELDKENVKGNDVVLKTGEDGTYIFQYNYYDSKHHITVYYPQARLKKGSYLYVDARNTNWVNNGGVGFGARYFYKYYDSGSDLETGNQVDCTTPLEYQVHYSIVPDNDYVGQVQIERKKPTKMDSTRWDYAQNIAAYSRTSSMQNCLSMENATGGTWSNFAPVWSTYCPIKKSTTITDNGTVTYGGNGESGTPYLVEKGTKIKVSAASEDYIEDTNMTTKYNFYDKGVSKQNGEGTTYEFTSAATAGTEYQINVNGYNYYNETASSNKFSTLLYYQTVTCHTVTYNANGGTGSLPAASGSKYVAGTNVTLATNAGGDAGSLERDGYVFIGWNTAANGSGTHYDAGATLTGIGDNVLLYAHWVALTTPTVTPTTTNWAGSDIDITLTATSTYLAEPVVVFYVNDGTTIYEVTGAPYGSDGSSLGTIGAAGSNYSTIHKATFTATTHGTYTVTAKLFEGKFIDNFESTATEWSTIDGSFERVANVERENKNASSTIMKITRNGEGYQTARTTTTETGGIPTDWNYSYDYIHMRFYAKQAEEPKVVYVDDGVNPVKETTLSSVSKEAWHKLAFAVSGGTVNMIYPQILSADGNSIYIDDIILSNESSMTAKVTTASASTTIRNTYTISYKDQFDQEFSGTQTTPPTTHTYGTATTLKIPTKSGYVFGGWYTQSDCSKGAIGTASSASIGATDLADDITLYAQWVTLSTPVVTPASTAWAGSDIAINLSATSTGLPNSVVVFLVNDGTNEYEVMGAPGAVGEEYDYSTTHTATFAAKTYGTYTVTAELYSGKFIDNFEGSASAWSGLGFGTCERVSNVEREADNGSTKVMKITRSTEAGHGEVQETAWTTTQENSGTKTSWDYSFDYIHMRYYTPQAETPEVEYWDDGISEFRNTTLSEQSANTWHELVFEVEGGVVNYIHPFITSAEGNSIYIDDVVLSNEETMTAKVTTASAATTIYSLSSVTVGQTSSADYFDTPIDISLSATSTGLENSVVIFLVNDGTTTFEVVGTPGTPGGEPLYYTVHNASFTTSTVGNYTVTAKLYEGKLIENFDGLSAYWKAMEDGTFDAAATNPAQQAVNGSSTVMQITRGNEEWQTVCTQQAADNDVTTDWNLDYGYIYISMYSTSARATKMKYSDGYSGTEVTSGDLAASTWTRVKFTVGSGHQVDFILPFMPADGTMYIDDIILSNESSMTAKATSQGAAASFRIKDNKYYFTGNNKSSTVWNNVDNWNRGVVPSSTSEVFILAPVEIATNTTVHVDKVNIVTGGELTPPGGSEMTASGHLTIASNAGLNVTGKIRKIADGAALDTRIATTPADLILESSTAGNASLIFENDENQATVLMYSKAYIDGNTWNWQFMGIPFTTTNANPTYYNSYLYKWASNGSGWEEVANGAAMTPFTGYCITQDAATTYVMDGTLTPNNDVAISIPDGKEFVMANSWSAPILVSGFTNTTLPLTNQTIYLYNTGYTPDPENPAEPGTEAGTYVAVPIHSAPYTGNDLIAPMQGFYVDNTSGSAATVTLKYDELVRPSIDRTIIAGPMHAPKRTQAQQADNHPVVLKIWANGAVYNDRAVLLERSDFSLGFDNGWDGKKLSFGEVGPSVYVINPLGEPEAVSAIPDLEGTLVGFRAGTNNTCTITFDYNGEDTFYLNDLQAQQSTQIASENSYTFTCTAGDNEARFVISATPISKTPTDVEPLTAHPSPLTVTKVLLNNHIYIIRDGRMFSMDGTLVK